MIRAVIRVNAPIYKRHSILTSWIISYFFIVLAITGISAVVYSRTQAIIKDEINRTNDVMLRQLQQSLDVGLKDIDTLMSQVSLNDKLRMLITWDLDHIEAIRFTPGYYHVSETVDELKKYKSVNSYVTGMYIYLKNSGMILSLDGLLDTETYYESMQVKPEYREADSYDDWLAAIKLTYTRKFRVVRNSDESLLKNVNNIKMVQTVPPNANSGATLVMILNKDRFMDSLNNISAMYNGWVMILDSENQVLFTNMPEPWAWDPVYDGLPGRTGLLNEDIGGKRHVVSYIGSERYKWKYITVIPYDLYQEKQLNAWKMMLGGVLVSLITGAALAVFFSSRNYNPVNKLVHSIKHQIANPDAGKRNEFTAITEAIRTTLNENTQITKILNQQNAVLKSNFLERLLKGRIEDGAFVDNALDTYGIRFVSKYFAVILFFITDCGMTPEGGALKTSAEDVLLARFILGNIAEEHVLFNNAGVVTEIDDMTACVVNFVPENAAAGKKELTRIMNESRGFARDNFGVAVRTAASGVHEGVYGLPAAYKEALGALEYKTVTENDGVMFLDEIKTPAYYYDYTFESEYRLINCIKSGETDVSLKIMNDIFLNILSKDDMSVEFIKCLVFDLAGTILKAIGNIDAKQRDDFLKKTGFPVKLSDCGTFSEMRAYMNKMLVDTCSLVRLNRDGKPNELAREVIDIIEENFTDADLNVSVIAENLKISPSYLTKVFKEHTGKGVLEYISGCRLSEAKRLLKESGLTVKDISIRAGYYNINAFNRMFKKSEGITPSSYRDYAV